MFLKEKKVLQKCHFRNCSKSCSILFNLVCSTFSLPNSPIFYHFSWPWPWWQKSCPCSFDIVPHSHLFAMYACDNIIQRKRRHLLQVKAKKQTSNKYVWIVFYPSFHPHTISGSKNNLNKRSLTDHFSKTIAFA